MASDSCTKYSSVKQSKTNGGQVIEGNPRKACPIPNLKVGKLDPSAKEVSRTVQNSASKEFTLLETKFVCSLAGKVDSNLHLGRSKQVQTLNHDNITSDDAGNINNLAASTKVSDGENGVTKANGGAKNIDRNDFVESGKSSLCKGITSTDINDESSCSSFSSSVNNICGHLISSIVTHERIYAVISPPESCFKSFIKNAYSG